MLPGANTIQSIHLLQRGGDYYVPADSGSGGLYRPAGKGQRGGYVATLETLWDFFVDNVPNPDEAKALDPDIESKLRMHPTVQATWKKRAFTVSALPWRFVPNPAAPKGYQQAAKDIADYCSDVWRRIPHLAHLYAWLQYAVLAGGQGLEMMWSRDESGSEVIEQPVGFTPVHMSRFMFDRLGNMALLTRDQSVWGVYVAPSPEAQFDRVLPHGKFVYHQHMQGQATWEQPHLAGYSYFGIGEDVSLYYVLTFDIFALRFRMKWLEKYGMPPTVLYHPDNRALTADILRIADSLRNESIISIPRLVGSEQTGGGVNSMYKVEQLPVPTMSTDAFNSLHREWSKPHIYEIMLGSAEEGQNTDGKGGYSEHVSRRDSGPNIWFRWDAANINETINTQLVPAMVIGRWPNLADRPEFWPQHVLEAEEEKDRGEELEIAQMASQLVPVPQRHIYEVSGIPEPQGDEPTVGGQAMMGGPDDGLGMPPGMGRPGMAGKPGAKPPTGGPQMGMPPQPKFGGGGGRPFGGKPPAPGMDRAKKTAVGGGGSNGKGRSSLSGGH